MAWSRWQLAEKAFFYDEDIRSTAIPAAPYPPHVEALRSSMLDFSCPFPGYQSLGDAVGGFQFDEPKNQWQGRDSGSALTAVYKIQNEAMSIHQGGYSEKRWESFFHDQFFKPLAESTSVSKAHFRRVSRCNYFYDAFRADGNLLWNLFRARADETDISDLTDFQAEKCPKPDYAFYLPMYHLDAEPRIPKIKDSEALQWNQSPGHTLADPFSWSTLKELVKYGLRPTPFRVFRNPPVEASLNCYPWLIVEHKKERVRRSEEVVCCQAANAGACAVKLNQIAARYAVELGDDAQVPPIPTVTTIGSCVKVWIMYFSRDFYVPSKQPYVLRAAWESCKKGYVMRAIWEGDMTKLEDIVKFQLVLENTHTWAMRALKPLLSSYIDQWKFVHCQAGITAANTALLHRQQIMEQCQMVVPMVQSFLNNQSAIELDDSKQSRVTPLLMGLLVQQICTLERQTLTVEVDRIITERIKALNLNSERITSETQQTSQPRKISTDSQTSGLSNAEITDCIIISATVSRGSPHTPKTHNHVSTPLSGSPVLGSSNTSTPTVSQTQDSETTTGDTPSKKVIFPFADTKWPPESLSLQPPSSPKPPIIDWKSPFGPVQF
ncbi:hypothetical protein B0J13DRAFT_590780 [Dactylonectria estremocensis]|uniref:Uncharacterized protein n=1 Tax=Dactylonectria estremocensis TaxID=1079267 RepID=A0A9P9D5W6_9HYPO|nr:hypothetical protein B0J13DRAFT_590780 [Dactylonectria estremocensis]